MFLNKSSELDPQNENYKLELKIVYKIDSFEYTYWFDNLTIQMFMKMRLKDMGLKITCNITTWNEKKLSKKSHRFTIAHRVCRIHEPKMVQIDPIQFTGVLKFLFAVLYFSTILDYITNVMKQVQLRLHSIWTCFKNKQAQKQVINGYKIYFQSVHRITKRLTP